MLETLLLYLSVLLLGTVLGVSSHLLQRSNKARLEPETFLWVQQVLLAGYGRNLGAIEMGAVSALAAALVTVWGEPLAVMLVGVALGCSLSEVLVWAIGLDPVNKQVNIWTPETLPEGWQRLRARWANLHVVRLILASVGLSSLLVCCSYDSKLLRDPKILSKISHRYGLRYDRA